MTTIEEGMFTGRTHTTAGRRSRSSHGGDVGLMLSAGL